MLHPRHPPHKHHKHPTVPSNTDCEILYLNQAGVVLNSPSKVFWRPLLAHSKLHLFLGPTSNLSAKAYTLNSSRDALHTWLTFHIQSWVVEIGKYGGYIVHELFIVVLLVGRIILFSRISYFAIIINIDNNGRNDSFGFESN